MLRPSRFRLATHNCKIHVSQLLALCTREKLKHCSVKKRTASRRRKLHQVAHHAEGAVKQGQGDVDDVVAVEHGSIVRFAKPSPFPLALEPRRRFVWRSSTGTEKSQINRPTLRTQSTELVKPVFKAPGRYHRGHRTDGFGHNESYSKSIYRSV